jgi:virginiamycin B lyase
MVRKSFLSAIAALTIVFGGATPGLASTPPILVWSPTTSPGTYDFGVVAPGESAQVALTLANVGGSGTSAIAVTTTGSPAFSIASDGCSLTSLSPRRSCVVIVRYSPTEGAAADVGTLRASGRKPNTSASLSLLGTSVAPRRIYWSNTGLDTIGRANIDGTGVNQAFITGSIGPYGMAIDEAHLYWANTPPSVGRADLDGGNVNSSFVPVTGSTFGVAVDPSHVYWASTDPDPARTGIGRADLDGQNATDTFIVGTIDPFDVAVDAGHIYWADCGRNAIGRANIDGSNVNLDFVTQTSCPLGLEVDSGHVYWTNYGTDSIGRADIDGQSANPLFITGASFPFGITVDSTHVYWTNIAGNSIGRADLDGQNVNQAFLPASSPRGVAVDPG